MQAGVKHIILAVSYRAEMLENELKVEEERVSILWCSACRLHVGCMLHGICGSLWKYLDLIERALWEPHPCSVGRRLVWDLPLLCGKMFTIVWLFGVSPCIHSEIFRYPPLMCTVMFGISCNFVA